MRCFSISACFNTVAMSSFSRRMISASCTLICCSFSICWIFTASAVTCRGAGGARLACVVADEASFCRVGRVFNSLLLDLCLLQQGGDEFFFAALVLHLFSLFFFFFLALFVFSPPRRPLLRYDVGL